MGQACECILDVPIESNSEIVTRIGRVPTPENPHNERSIPIEVQKLYQRHLVHVEDLPSTKATR